jgi:hypothetical protein
MDAGGELVNWQVPPDLKSISSKPVSRPREEGIVPVKTLPSQNQAFFSDVSQPREDGRVPLNELPPTSKCVTEARFPSRDGSVPMKPEWSRLKCLSLVRSPRVEGYEPVRPLFPPTFRYVRPSRYPIVSGIPVPDKLL